MNKSESEVQAKTQTTDEELIARFQQGDNYAFDLLVKRYKEPLLNFVFRFLGDATEADYSRTSTITKK